MKSMQLTNLKEVKVSMTDFRDALWSELHDSDIVEVSVWLIDAKNTITEAIEYIYDYKSTDDEYKKLGYLSLYDECIQEAITHLENALTMLKKANCDENIRKMVFGHCEYQISKLKNF